MYTTFRPYEVNSTIPEVLCATIHFQDIRILRIGSFFSVLLYFIAWTIQIYTSRWGGELLPRSSQYLCHELKFNQISGKFQAASIPNIYNLKSLEKWRSNQTWLLMMSWETSNLVYFRLFWLWQAVLTQELVSEVC